MKYRSQILILLVLFFCIYCFGKVLRSGIRESLFQHTSANRIIQHIFANQIKSKGHKSSQLGEGMISEILARTQSTTHYDSYVAIVSSNTINPLNRDGSYSIEAFGQIVENGVKVNAGDLIIGNVTINPDNNNYYHYTYPLSDGKALFGTSVEAEIDDPSATARRTRVIMFVPKELYPSTLSLPQSTVDRTADYSLAWEPDANNQFGQVQIQISYNKGLSQYYNSSMSSSIEDLVYRVADNGNYVIPQADLARFPKDSYVSISIARAWLDNVSSNIAYVAITEAHTPPLLVIEPVSACNNQYTITGNEILCSSDVYSIGALPAGTSVTWSSTPAGIVNIPNPNVSPVTLNYASSGNVTLTATITNACNQTSSEYKYIRVGGYSSSDYPVSGPSSACTNSDVYFNTNVLAAATNYQWFWPNDWTYVSGQGTPYLALRTGYNANSGSVGVRVANQCDAGGSPGMQYVQVNDCGYYYYMMSPNPASTTVTISAKETTPKGEKSDKTITEVNIYEQQGNLKKHEKFSKVKTATVNISGLNNGVYFVEIADGNFKERQKLIIQK